ncbi:hypothetical protein [Endozoicomonas sp. GU-1]|uniref:phage tail assembly chaperone n=1 Tax=Endozoicomonas sp. GU-1 TaxID=3009078 RepID=UPI0022B58F5E|nr:hypothetical protein [Endozoicomonas sp. GU-1]WBA79550.1 hypothetical protein O2T12_14295 [Endozoicomonas sp. GU-1]
MKPPKGDKSPLKVHLLKVYESTGVKPKQLQEQPEKPREMDYLLCWFYGLHNATRGAISYTEIYHWAKLTKVNIRAWEVAVMQRLSVAFSNG